jgi:uncharacterized protein YciI
MTAAPQRSGTDVSYYALFYDAASDYAARRAPHRDAHLALVREAHARGEVVMGGALGDPPEGAMIVFRGESSDVAERFANRDPYVLNHVVTSWRVRPWIVVVGGEG